jgi:hypothetical protein
MTMVLLLCPRCWAETAAVEHTQADCAAQVEANKRNREAWLAEHECEDVAGGALDAQAEAERRFFLVREALQKLLDASVAGSEKEKFRAQKKAAEVLRETA